MTGIQRALLSLGVALGVAIAVPAADEPPERSFVVHYSTSLRDIPEGAKRVAIWMPYPSSDAHQEVTDVQVEGPANARVTKEGEYGNRMLYVEVEHPKEPSLDLAISFAVRRREYARRDLDAPAAAGKGAVTAAAHDLEPNRLGPLGERIRRMAAEVTAGKSTDLERARAIYDYVVATMKYDKSGTGWGNGDLIWACDNKRGNCTDFHALFIGLCRAAGIPARFSIGLPIPAARGEGTIPGYHCWAEFFVKGRGWIPVDASEAAKNPGKVDYYFGAHDENRVQLSQGRDILLSPRQKGAPLNYFVYPYVEVDGAPFDHLTKQMTYRDRDGG